MSGLFKLFRKKKIFSNDKYLYLGYGEDMLSKEEGRIFANMGDGEGRHLVIFGASGSGKTEFLTRKTYEEILLGLQVFCIDPKGSKSWIEAFLGACMEKGILKSKEEGPVILALPYPEVSVKFNPLQGLTPHQIADVISSGVPPSKEAFWRDISYEITLAVALGLKARGKQNITLSDIYDYIKVEKLEELRNKVLADVGSVNEYRDEALNALDKIATYDPQFFPRVNASLRTYLTRLITGVPGRIFNVEVSENVIEERLESGVLRFYAFLNSEAMKQVAYDVARLLFAWLLVYTGRQSSKLRKIQPQLRLNVDEVTEIGFYEVNKAIRLVRERNVSVTLATQSPHGFMASFKEKGREIVSDIINSCDTRIFMKLNSPEDSEYAARFCPEVLKPRAIIHKNHVSITYTKFPVLEPFVFQTFEPGSGIAFCDGTAYIFYSPFLKDKPSLKIIWEENIHTDGSVEVDMRELSKNYTSPHKPVFSDAEVKYFYEEFKTFVKIYREDFEKCLKFIDGVKLKSSVVKGKSPLRAVSLLDHSFRVARKAYTLVKDSELSQEEKERVFIAALAHDFGKAVADSEKYTTSDHIRLTKEILKKLGISDKIIELAFKHHEKSEDSLLVYVKKADHLARKEEEEKVISKQNGEIRFKLSQFREFVGREINLREDYLAVSDTKKVYLEKDYVRKVIKNIIGKELGDDEIKKLTGGDFREVVITVRNQIVKQGVYLILDNWNVAEFTQRKKINRKLFQGFRVQIVS